MPINDFLPIATAGGANVQDQATYAGNPDRTAFFADGSIPDANEHGKMFRQSSSIASALAQVVCDLTGLDMLDNGVAATLVANIKSLMQSAALLDYAADTGGPNAYVVALTPVLLAHVPGLPIKVKIKAAGNNNPAIAAATFNPGPGVKPLIRPNGLPLQYGDLIAGGVYTFVYDGASYQVAELAGANAAVRRAAPVTVPNTNVATNILLGLTNTTADGIVVVESRFADAFPGTNFCDILICIGSQTPVVMGTSNNTGGGSAGVRTYTAGAGLQCALTGAVAAAPMNIVVYGSGFSI